MAEGKRPLLHAPGGCGPIERTRVRGLAAVAANAVGGGSQLYTSITTPAPAVIFEQAVPGGRRAWPDSINAETMALYYGRVDEVIRPTPVPRGLTRTRALEAALENSGGSVTRPPLAMDWPADAARMDRAFVACSIRREVTTWLQGGATARKRTLDHTYLGRAEAAGARVLPLHEVFGIEPESGGYRVRYRQYGECRGREDSLSAKRVVVAAGTLATVRLLLHARDVAKTLPRLGQTLGERFFTNGDFGGLIVGAEMGVARDCGPPVTAWADWWETDKLYLMESGLLPQLPGLLMRALGLLIPAARGQGAGPVGMWSFGVVGFDETPHRLALDGKGRLSVIPGQRDGSMFHERSLTRLQQLAAALNAKLILPPKALAPPGLVTVHPLGGAAMADSPEWGVTDAFGEVYGHSGLFVADASLLPTPIGRPPSMTIAAMAERVAQRLVSAV